MREDIISSLFCIVWKKGEDKIITFLKRHKIAQYVMLMLCFFGVFQNFLIMRVSAESNNTLKIVSAWNRGDPTDASVNKWVVNVQPFYAEGYGTLSFLTYDTVFEVNGERVFCLEPVHLVDKNKLDQYSPTVLSSIIPNTAVQKQIKWISALGYGYNDDYSHEMAWATQIRIWQEINSTVVTKIHPEIQAKIDEINTRLNAMNKTVSWDNQEIVLSGYGKENAKTITDTNNVFQYYVENQNNKIHTEKTGNNLKIWLEDGDKETSILTYNAFYKGLEGEDIVYYNPFSQAVAKLKGGISTQAKLSVKVAKGSLDLTKTNNVGDLLDGSEFNLKSVTEGINYNKNIIVKDGHIKVDDLIAGKYVLTEVKSPNHYVVSEFGYPVIIKGNETTDRIVVNYIRPVVELTIKKSLEQTDNENVIVVNSTPKSTEGIQYNITAAEDIYDLVNETLIYKKNASISIGSGNTGNGDAVTLVEGKVIDSTNGIYATSSTGTIKLNNLPMGKYNVKEIKTKAGYILDKNTYNIEFKKENGNFEQTVYINSAEFNNKISKVGISKKDITDGKLIEGAKLSIREKSTDKVIAEWISNSKNEQLVYGLTEGNTYILREDLAPVGYTLAQDVEFNVSNTGEIQKVEMNDIPEYKKVRIKKIDSKTKKTINSSDAEFTLYADAECSIPLQVIKTDNEGYAVIDNLTFGFANNKNGEKGIYYVKETKAPKGYRLSKEVVKIEIDEDTEPDSYTIEYENQLLPAIRTGVIEYIGIAILIFIVTIIISCCVISKRISESEERED